MTVQVILLLRIGVNMKHSCRNLCSLTCQTPQEVKGIEGGNEFQIPNFNFSTPFNCHEGSGA